MSVTHKANCPRRMIARRGKKKINFSDLIERHQT